MTRSWCRAITLAAMFGATLSAGACQAQPAMDPRVQSVIDRTRQTHVVYANYIWGTTAWTGVAPSDEWSAEFHSGDLHRVENPRIRAVADCKAMTGAYLDIATGKITRDAAVARVSCGISTNAPFKSSRYDGSVQSPFGPAERFTVSDGQQRRTYDVTADGAIVRSYFILEATGEMTIDQRSVAVLPTLPATDIFDEASLSRSFVPDQYKTPPKTAGQ